MWEVFEGSAVEVLQRTVDAQPFDRQAVLSALHLFAMAKNRDPHVPMPPLDIFTDAELRNMVQALLSGNQIGA